MRRNAAMELYVSPFGSDRWSGRLPDPGGDGTDGPFATLARARDEIRALKPRSPCRIILRGGLYALEEPVVFTPEDSGTAEAPIAYAAYRGETPVLSGGVRIGGWRKTTVQGKTAWVTDAPDWPFQQLWVNGGRRYRPRLPKEGFYRIARPTEGADWYGGTREFHVRPGDVKSWKNLGDVEMVLLTSWLESRLPIESVNETEGRVATRWRSAIAPSEGSRFYVENVFEELTQPGTWYCDRAEKTLCYLPFPGEEPEATDVIAPRLPAILAFEGEAAAGRYVEHLSFEGLSFAHTEWRRSASTPIMRYDLRDIRTKKLIYMASVADDKAGDHLAAVSVPGAIAGVGIRACRFAECTFAHVGGYGIELGRGCHDNAIASCVFRDLGAGGIKLGTQDVRDAPLSYGNRIEDCDIGPGGLIFHGAVGIWLGQTPHNRVAHNSIHDLYYTGISVGWSMGYVESAAFDNAIEWNHIHHLGKGWLSDFGGIYMLGNAPGTVVRFNVIHDLASGEYGACGLYYDEGSCHVVGENNLLYNIDGDAFFMHYGQANVLRNNILAGCAKGALGSSVDVLEHGRVGEHCAVTIERNIIYLRGGDVYRSQWNPKRFVIRRNLVWDANGRPLFCGGRPWSEWQREGMDAGSRVADPLFAAPDRGDFTLSPESPALALGFVPFDVSGAGPRWHEQEKREAAEL